MRTGAFTHLWETSEPSQWRHVSAKDNPADDASRGMKVSDFLKNRWLDGPAFLSKDEENWPKIVLYVTVDGSDKEVRKEATANAIRVCDMSSPTEQLIAYFSAWRRLKTTVALLLRLKAMLLEQRHMRKQLEEDSSQDSSVQAERQQVKSVPRSSILTLDKLLKAQVSIIRFCQRQRFSEEISALSSKRATVS